MRTNWCLKFVYVPVQSTVNYIPILFLQKNLSMDGIKPKCVKELKGVFYILFNVLTCT